jgi:hypothetical protein
MAVGRIASGHTRGRQPGGIRRPIEALKVHRQPEGRPRAQLLRTHRFCPILDRRGAGARAPTPFPHQATRIVSWSFPIRIWTVKEARILYIGPSSLAAGRVLPAPSPQAQSRAQLAAGGAKPKIVVEPDSIGSRCAPFPLPCARTLGPTAQLLRTHRFCPILEERGRGCYPDPRLHQATRIVSWSFPIQIWTVKEALTLDIGALL